MLPILVLRRGGLGDTLLMLPVVRALRRLHPAAELHVAGVREFADVLCARGACDVARSSEDLMSWSPTQARTRLGGYAHVVADDPAVTAAHASVRLFDPRPRDASPLGLQLARQLGLAPHWPEDAWFAPRPIDRPDGAVVLAPGSGGRTKCWPQSRWLELAAALATAAPAVAVVVGPTEIERDDPRAWPWPGTPTFVVEAQVTTLAARLEQAAAFVGNDSGTTHLAAMLGVPTVALFGPSDARVWAPVGPQVHVISMGSAMADIGVAAVVEALRWPWRSATVR